MSDLTKSAIKDKNSEELFELLYSPFVLKKEFEFAIKTNELIECSKESLPENYGFPDFLLCIDGQKIIAEVTTAHDLDDPNVIDTFIPSQVKIISGDIMGKISARIYNKMAKGNFKNIDDFKLPIIFVVFNNQQSSFIDKTQIDCFLNDYRKCPPNIKKKQLLDENYWVIEKIPRYKLISGILFIESNPASLRVKYFPSENNQIPKSSIEKLEKPLFRQSY